MGQELRGVIEEKLPQGLYRVLCEGGERVLASVSSMARKTAVKFIPGDPVVVEISSIDPSRGRIIERQG